MGPPVESSTVRQVGPTLAHVNRPEVTPRLVVIITRADLQHAAWLLIPNELKEVHQLAPAYTTVEVWRVDVSLDNHVVIVGIGWTSVVEFPITLVLEHATHGRVECDTHNGKVIPAGICPLMPGVLLQIIYNS